MSHTRRFEQVGEITTAQLRWFRLCRSGLVDPFDSAEQCARQLVGIQSQMPVAAALAFAHRLPRFSFVEFKELLYEKRSLVRTWGQRNTLHTYYTKDWPLFISAFCSRSSWARDRFLRDGGSPFDYNVLIAQIEESLRTCGRLNRADLEARLDRPITSWGGVLIDAAYRGLLCDAGGSRFAHGIEWLSKVNRQHYTPEQSCMELIKRYIRGYGSATLKDIAYWFGCRMSDVQSWIANLELAEIYCDKNSLLIAVDDVEELLRTVAPVDGDWPVLMLYRFDPLLLAYRDKNWIVAGEFQSLVWGAAGHVAGVVLENGKAVATWHYRRQGKRSCICLSEFNKLRSKTKKFIEQYEQSMHDFFC